MVVLCGLTVIPVTSVCGFELVSRRVRLYGSSFSIVSFLASENTFNR